MKNLLTFELFEGQANNAWKKAQDAVNKWKKENKKFLNTLLTPTDVKAVKKYYIHEFDLNTEEFNDAVSDGKTTWLQIYDWLMDNAVSGEEIIEDTESAMDFINNFNTSK